MNATSLLAIGGGAVLGAAVAVFHINVELPPEPKLFFIPVSSAH